MNDENGFKSMDMEDLFMTVKQNAEEFGYDISFNEAKFQAHKNWFLTVLTGCYQTILQDTYNYLTSKEAIIETIEANEYEFDQLGNLI